MYRFLFHRCTVCYCIIIRIVQCSSGCVSFSSWLFISFYISCCLCFKRLILCVIILDSFLSALVLFLKMKCKFIGSIWFYDFKSNCCIWFVTWHVAISIDIAKSSSTASTPERCTPSKNQSFHRHAVKDIYENLLIKVNHP